MQIQKYNGEKADFGIERIKLCHATKEKLFLILDREPTLSEIASEMDFPEKYVDRMLQLRVEENEVEEEREFELRVRMTIKNHELERVRLAMGLKQDEIADRLKINSYSHIETCRQYPNDIVQQKLSDFFGKPKEQLFPEWLKVFSENWKNAEKSRIVPASKISLSSREVLSLESGDVDEMIRLADNSIANEKIKKALEDLPPKEKEIIILRNGLFGNHPHTLEEVGNHFGVIRERIRQIEAKAMERLRCSGTLSVIYKSLNKNQYEKENQSSDIS